MGVEAKDTVIKPGELGLAIIKHPELPMGQAISIEQAEISFPAGEKVGRREVVEWIHNHGGSLDGNRVEWQAQLKVWGIEVDHED